MIALHTIPNDPDSDSIQVNATPGFELLTVIIALILTRLVVCLRSWKKIYFTNTKRRGNWRQ